MKHAIWLKPAMGGQYKQKCASLHISGHKVTVPHQCCPLVSQYECKMGQMTEKQTDGQIPD